MKAQKIESKFFTFHLNQGDPAERFKLTYAVDGDFAETETIEFRAPGMDEFEEASNLAQLAMGAIMESLNANLAKDIPGKAEEAKTEVTEVNGAAIRVMLFTSQKIKFTEVAKYFNSLAVKVGTTDGKTPLTQTILKKMELETYTRMLCEYIAHFIFPSLMSGIGEG